MLIAEVSSGDSSGDGSRKGFQKRIDSVVSKIEQTTPTISSKDIEELQGSLAGLPSELTDEEKMAIWRLSYRIWNTCVDMVNNMQAKQVITEDHVRLRHIASEMLLAAGCVGAVRSSLLKMAMFFYKTGVFWNKVSDNAMASVCFERATELLAKSRGENAPASISEANEEQQLMFDLYLARSRTSWELSHKALACSLLGRSRGLLSSNTQRHQELADLYLHYGKASLAKEDPESKADSIKYMEQAFEICCESLNGEIEEGEKKALGSQRLRILRYLAAGHLQNGNFESVMKCVSILKNASDHPSTPFLAFKALAGLGRFLEAEKELYALVVHDKAAKDVCASAIEVTIQDYGQVQAAKNAFYIAWPRFACPKELPVRIIEKLLNNVSPLDDTSKTKVDVALQIAHDEKVISTITRDSMGGLSLHVPELQHGGKEQQSIHALLWNSGSDHFQAKKYDTAIKLFEASMLYLPKEGDGSLQRSKSLRVLCLCHIGLQQYDRAAEYVTAAEKLEKNIACAFLKFKICLQTSDEAGAINQVQMMATCPDFEPDFLTLASHEAIACKFTRVAISALSSMLGMCTSSMTPSDMNEAVIYRNLITVATEDLNCKHDAAQYLKKAQARSAEIGFERFFGSGTTGEKEANWFAGMSWNEGLAAAKSSSWKLCAELFACSSEFYSILPQSPENLRCLETSLVMAVAAALAIETQENSEHLKQASNYLEKCQKIHTLLLKDLDPAKTDENFYVHWNLLAFDLKGKTGDHKGQLEILHHCSSLPGFKPDYFFKMALHASSERTGSPEVAAAAFRSCLNLLLGSASPDYTRIALILRKLIGLADLRKKDGQEVLKLYNEANNILLGLSMDSYPKEEVQWLVSTAWNRAALHLKLLHLSDAQKWMELALDLLKHAPAMEVHRPAMVESLSDVLKQKSSHSQRLEE
ncbi:hypothetical protein O6H91_03G115400 [Diphasiastrum complanatum]|uniref:Uncharacterized protein n=1 Tax=Diphasiastrum complanatum TaxID=34168 RepID=A0ACC2EB34_DIPCM|nr:hypothetical protein O6H91_03G115400 [Diphasiastrum complanatum]